MQVEPRRGIRLGCGLSPVVWAVYTGLFHREFMYNTKQDSTQPEVTMYADDKHLSWLFHNVEELREACRQLALFLQLLKIFGMEPSPDKSKAILSIRGCQPDKHKSEFAVRRNDVW